MPSPGIPAQPVVAQRESRAGGSARAEYDRRVAARERTVRERHPRLGGVILALTEEPTSTRVWAQGARGEEAVAATLDKLTADGVLALHDRSMPGRDGRRSRANVDHIAVAASGVWVIDAKTHKGKLEVRRSGGLFTPRTERLFIAGRDRSDLLDGLRRQVAAVADVVHRVDAAVPVRGALCFVGTELPWFDASVDGIPLVGRRGLAKLLKHQGELVAADRERLVHAIAAGFLPA